MKFSDIKASIIHQFAAPRGNRVVPFILGAPGGGKSALTREVVQDMGITNTLEFTGSLRDPTDVLGMPSVRGECAQWIPPQEFYQLRKGVGRCALILEELSDATIPMQNALCGIVYDRRAGQLELSDELFILATGNRTQDKSGANRITTKLSNRTRIYEFTENIEDWTRWALANDVDPVLIQFLRFRPALLSDFDPNRMCNPTPRSWERVNLIPETLPTHLLYENVAGEVGEAAAAEYTGFIQIYRDLPDIDGILLDPGRAPVPQEMSTLYALTGALAKKATGSNFDRVVAYLGRLPIEFNIWCVRDALALKGREVRETRAFVEWASKHGEVLM